MYLKYAWIDTLRQRKILVKHESTRDVNTLWKFYHAIAVGDRIIARRGTKTIVGVGTVIKPAFYDENKGKERVDHQTVYYYPNFLKVRWDSPGRN